MCYVASLGGHDEVDGKLDNEQKSGNKEHQDLNHVHGDGGERHNGRGEGRHDPEEGHHGPFPVPFGDGAQATCRFPFPLHVVKRERCSGPQKLMTPRGE